jgi:tetratricopeptide (TPR) repeat protein
MKILEKTVLLLFACGIAPVLFAQSAHSWLRDGDKSYESQNFPEAEVNYRRALEKEKSTQGTYNLGNSIYRQERFDEAAKHYESSAIKADDKTTKAKAFHNLGNSYFQKKQYDKSVEAYKNALRLNPNDMDTKRNLTLALEQLRVQQQQQQQQQNKQQQQQQKPQQEKPQKQKEQQLNDQQKEQQEQPQDLNQQEAEQLLEIMNREEQKVQQKLRKSQSRPPKTGKDW